MIWVVEVGKFAFMNPEHALTQKFSQELVNTSIDTGIDYAEMGIDQLFTDELLKEVPIIKTAATLVKIGINVREKFFVKKLLTFLKEFHTSQIDPQKLSEFKNTFDIDSKKREKITEQLLIFLDAHLTIEKSQILAKLFRAHIEGNFDWAYFCSLATSLDRLHPHSIQFLHYLSNYQFKIPMNPERDRLGIVRDHGNESLLSASGLAGGTSVWDSMFEVSDMGKDLFNYGIK